MRKLLDDNGLKCCGTHTGLDTLEGDALAKTIEFNKTIGNKFLIVPWIDEKRRQTADDWKKLAAQFDATRGQGRARGDARRLPQPRVEFTPLAGKTPWDLFFGERRRPVIQQVDTRQLHRRRRRPGRSDQGYPGPHDHHPPQGVLEDEAGRLHRRRRRAVEGSLRGLRDGRRDRVVHRRVRAREPAGDPLSAAAFANLRKMGK